MQNATVSGNVAPVSEQGYSPSVPISLYREVAAELQEAQARLESLKAHNQQLIQQNQQLQREINTVVNAAHQLQQAVNSAQAIGQSGIPQMSPLKVLPVSPEPPNPAPQPVSHFGPGSTPNVALPFSLPDSEPSEPLLSEQLFTEEPEAPYRLRTQPKTASDLGGLWLAVAMFLIVIAAFGAGYWIVRPLIMKR